ncbi:hypothetical protein ACH4LN_25290 [Streptomyces albus]|uniref:hypothetical protein n=1 Tax=Streptomyces albus TaxID=1888 RepID=UPI0006B46B97|nr:hypothetical protein [Streptomyces albus]KPC65767.1 hypothetical protein ADL27_59920 [Streptomyces sp. NRRL F-6602]QID35050.1 hypothetical protein G3260_000949 [Streptomyces albus]
MPATLPVPIEFRLPEGWHPADPDKAGAPGVAVAAVLPEPDDGFVANITIDGAYRLDAASLHAIAEESVQQLRQVAESVQVIDRTELGSRGAPAVTQTLEFSASTGGTYRPLIQSQVHLAMLDETEPQRRAVIRLVLTATPSQIDSVVGDFMEFIGTVRPAAHIGD